MRPNKKLGRSGPYWRNNCSMHFRPWWSSSISWCAWNRWKCGMIWTDIFVWPGNPAGKQYRDIRFLFCIYFFWSVDVSWSRLSEWNMDLLYVYRLGKSWRLHYVRQAGNERNRRKSWLYQIRNCLNESLLDITSGNSWTFCIQKAMQLRNHWMGIYRSI